jgi:hypothetical protein
MKEIIVNELTENQTLLLKIHLDGQDRFTSVVARTRTPPTAEVMLGRVAADSYRSVSSCIGRI